MKPETLILGLGNPGSQYQRTRHNVGFLSLDQIAKEVQVSVKKALFYPFAYALFNSEDRSVMLVKPFTYMNRSGDILPRLLRKYTLSDDSLIVICDNLDLPPGAIRVRKGGGTAGHRGLASIQQRIGSSDFIRIYIGIGRPDAGSSVVDYVLGIPDEQQEALILQGVNRARDAAKALLTQPLERVMNEYNRKNAHSLHS